ncbi:hypothetical protein CI610_00111 [invertebrate metagenome]|uniref:Uncharacterized protein n=1 Tax=invertebrate metagenome TaxID=1711999 RepID=A0A2H9TCE7_9ZZZZ
MVSYVGKLAIYMAEKQYTNILLESRAALIETQVDEMVSAMEKGLNRPDEFCSCWHQKKILHNASDRIVHTLKIQLKKNWISGGYYED